MRIAIINQFAPPDESPTSILAGDLAKHLEADGHDVQILACGSDYRIRKRNRGSRLFHELASHVSLFWKSLRFRRADVLLALSSPACLPVTVSLAARIKRCRFAHWAMDVYPDVAVALGEVRRDSVLHRLTQGTMARAYRRANPLVALNAEMAQALGGTDNICPPWPPSKLRWPPISPSPSKPFTWLYSGNLGRAHLYRPLLLTQKELERNGVPAHLVFQGGGPLIPQAKALADELGLENCEFRDYAPHEQLLESLFAADILVATQSEETRGLLWPSKLAVMNYVPRPVLWIGPDPSIAASIFDTEDIEGMARWIEQLVGAQPSIPYSPPPPPRVALESWSSWLKQA